MMASRVVAHVQVRALNQAPQPLAALRSRLQLNKQEKKHAATISQEVS
jgi:hypothetical protein